MSGAGGALRMRRGTADLLLMLVAPLAALLLYSLVAPLSPTAGAVGGSVLMLALAVARRPAGA